MLTKQNQIGIIIQIANLFYPSSSVAKASCITRMQTKLNDQTFDYFVSNLQQGTFYVTTNTPLGFIDVPGLRFYKYSIKVVDLIRGTTQTNPLVKIPEPALVGKNIVEFWNLLAHAWDTDFIVTGVNPDNSCIIHSPDVGSYGIELGSTPGGGGTGGGGEGGTGGGVVVIPKPPDDKKTPLPGEKPPGSILGGGFDLNSLIIPGAALVLAYLLFKD